MPAPGDRRPNRRPRRRVWRGDDDRMGRKIVIVGNGGVGQECAAGIEAADFVIRCNDCRSYRPGGGRTDAVAVCNTGRPAKAMLAAAEWRSHPAVAAASEIWCVRDPQKFAELRPALARGHPRLDDFCDDYTAGFAAFCAQADKTHVIIGRRAHEALDKLLTAAGAAPYVVPSTGLIVIGEVLDRNPDADVAIAGFDHSGWDGHPFAAERRVVDGYVAAGRLRRLAERQLACLA